MAVIHLLDPFYFIEGRNLLFKGGGGSAPAAPDPAKTAAAQTATNKETAYWNAVLNNVNQITPYGNLTYAQTGGGKQYNQSAYDKALASYNSGGTGTTTNPYDHATQKSQYNQWEQQNGSGASGSRGAPRLEDFLIGDSPPSFTSTVQLTPEMQKLLDSDLAQKQRLSDIGGSQLDRVAQSVNTPYSYEGLPEIPGLNDIEDERKRVEDALYSRLDPQFARDEERLRGRLANQGIMQGSDAYTTEIERLNQAKNDARSQAVLAGGQEQSRLFGLGQAARNQSISEYDRQRNAPLNEYTALTSGVQVQNPQFQNYNYQGTQPADIAGLTQNAYNSALNSYNAKQAQSNNTMGSLFGLGGSLLGAAGQAGGFAPLFSAFSDVRLKENIERIGQTPAGIGVYEYNFIGSNEREIGVLAHEVEEIIPEAVTIDPSGYKRVYYGMVR